ncbi:hypothetical protein SAMN05216327_101276 [Dyadobacter sp. SG02]|uniref:hypothetical protein n=1 Tax=Dyadobacter sp. SG02 TaxID=1855291 RepID=UPI0008CE5156|nr:hypothetical protein [Dyadobacter sp. SG02]SEI40371.1 hypothetical protein SAMN05216327_101276 [Dyadobacter sp. SG02]
MKKYILLLAMNFPCFLFGQKPVSIPQEVAFATLDTKKTVRVSLDFPEKSFSQLREDKQDIRILLRLKDVLGTLVDKILLGAQRPESVENQGDGKNTLVFAKDWNGKDKTVEFVFIDISIVGPTPKTMKVVLTKPKVVPPIRSELVVDLCTDSNKPVVYPMGRSWAFVLPREKTRMVVKHINPLRNSVSIDVASMAFNTDAKQALSNVAGLLDLEAVKSSAKGATGANDATSVLADTENVIVEKLLSLVSISDSLTESLSQWQKLDCLTDDDLNEIEKERNRVYVLIKPYPNEIWLDLELKDLTDKVETIAKNKNAILKDFLKRLSSYAKRDGLAKETFALFNAVKAIKDGATVITPLIDASDYPNADVLRFTMTKSNKLDSTSNPVVKSFDVWVVGRVKLDFSAGLLLTGLADQTHAAIDQVASQTRVVEGASQVNEVVRQTPVDERRDNVSLAIATLGHVYWRTSCWKGGLNPGVSIGAGLTTKGRPLYLLGASVMIGRRQRIVLNGGAAVGTRKELSLRYDTTSNYFPSDPAEDFTYVDRTRVSWFAGLTFNFGQNEKREAIIGK